MTGQHEKCDGCYEVVLEDGTVLTDHDTLWSSISERMTVGYFGAKKTVHASTLPVKHITAFFGDLHSVIEVPSGCRAYQAIRSESLIMPGYERRDRVIGRTIGLIKEGEVVEEHFLNGQSNKVEGLRK